MPIYDISGLQKNPREEAPSFSGEAKEKSHFISSLLSRLFFSALLLFDIAWCAYAVFLFIVSTLFCMRRLRNKAYLSLKRSLACGLALIAAIFSPAFGIMIACTYFLMYDKNGIEEIVPASLQDQFRDFFK